MRNLKQHQLKSAWNDEQAQNRPGIVPDQDALKSGCGTQNSISAKAHGTMSRRGSDWELFQTRVR